MKMIASQTADYNTDIDIVSLSSREPSTVLCTLHHPTTPVMTVEVLNALNSVLRQITVTRGRDCQCFVLQSAREEVFSLGGDLDYFVKAVKAGNRAALEDYMALCLEMIEATASGLYAGIHTIAAVRGKAFGGGFEAALSCNTIIAEEDAQFGCPESLFNMFPGMGAHLLLEKRVGAGLAERIMRDGRLFSARELFDIGIVDKVVNKGGLDEGVRQYIDVTSQRALSRSNMDRIRRLISPLDSNQLKKIGEIWIESALSLNRRDLELMSRIARAQHQAYKT